MINSNAPEADYSNLPNVHHGRSFDVSSSMDWAPTPDNFQTRFHHQGDRSDNVELDQMNPSQGGGGVGRLVAHFENKTFAPPLPPRPSNIVTNDENANPPASSPFGSYNVASPIIASPLASPNEQGYSFFGGPQRVASPIASPIAFGGFHEMSHMHSPGAGPSSDHFGSMNSFMTSDRMTTTPMDTSSMMGSSMTTLDMAAPPMNHTPKVAPANVSTPDAVPGTPGFAIWRPPVPVTQKPSLGQPQSSNTSSSGYFAKPPIPSTPKPIMNAGTQLVLDFNNMGSQAKGKAPVRPPTKPPRQLTRQPSKQSISTPPAFSPSIKHEPSTPQLSHVPASSLALPVCLIPWTTPIAPIVSKLTLAPLGRASKLRIASFTGRTSTFKRTSPC